MAFTIEEIEKAITTPRPEWPMYYPQIEDFKTNPSYEIITDYLIGKANHLNQIQNDNKNFSLGMLINLLSDIENISLKEQLVLDVIFHPNINIYLKSSFNNWLTIYLVNNESVNSFNAVLLQLTKQGMNNADIFEYLILAFCFGNYQFDFNKKKIVKDYLLNDIKKTKNLILPTFAWNLSMHSNWSETYFKLLEEARPEFVKEYICVGLQVQVNECVKFIEKYCEGKYLPIIFEFFEDKKFNSEKDIVTKYIVAISLYELNNEKYKILVNTESSKYLDFKINAGTEERWGQGFNLIDFNGTDLNYLPLSTIAFHFLLQHETEKGFALLNKWFNNKTYTPFKLIRILYLNLNKSSFEFIEKSFTTKNISFDFVKDTITLMINNFEATQYVPIIWQLINSKSKPIRQFVAKTIAENDAEVEKKAIALLQNKSSETRQTAATILSYFSTDTATKAIINVLDTETNDIARDTLLQTVAESLPTNATMEIIAETIAAAANRGKLSKPIEPWLEEEKLPPLFYTTGKELSIEETRFLMYRMSRIKEMRSDIEAKYILQFLDHEKSSPFALQLMKLYMEHGAKPEQKWIMALAALLGNDAVVDKIRITINKWMEENRYKMAEHGVGALALHGSDKALRWVEWYSRKYRSKKANVGNAALVALENAAFELKISIHELGDKIVPDFGFDGLYKNFEIDGEEYRAFIDSNFKMAFFNDDNKKLKAIPSNASAQLKDECKAIAKEVRDIVKSQSPRLEYYLIIQRKWTLAQWKNFFLQNPVMFIYATKLIWGTYNSKSELLKTFICNEDTSLINEEHEEMELDEDCIIGIVHPTQLPATLLQKWKQLIFDLSIEQVFPQLDRKIAELKNIDLEQTIIRSFEGKQMAANSIKSTLEKFGWHKGPTGDSGYLESMNLLYFEKKIEAVLELEGVGVGYGWGTEEKLGKLYIINKEKQLQKWIGYISKDDDERLVKLKNVPPIFLSEMFAAIEQIKPIEKD